jgi:hypothetical protein
MGKHERQEIEEMEKSVANCLNGHSPSILETHKWYAHMSAFVNHIKEICAQFKKAEHIGNEYGKEVGDIKLVMKDDTRRYFELKASESASGKGTLANITQNAITEYGLLLIPENQSILSWAQFRKRGNFSTIIQGLLNSYEAPGQLDFNKKAELIKEKATAGDKDAISIKAKIIAYANRDKKDYINYVRSFKPHKENIIKFVFCLLNGIHTKNEIKAVMASNSLEEIEQKADVLTTLYSNQRGGTIIVSESTNRMDTLIEDFERFSFSFPETADQVVSTHIVGFEKSSGREQQFIKLQLNWKNIFQGIKTPCINVFLGSFFESY